MIWGSLFPIWETRIKSVCVAGIQEKNMWWDTEEKNVTGDTLGTDKNTQRD